MNPQFVQTLNKQPWLEFVAKERQRNRCPPFTPTSEEMKVYEESLVRLKSESILKSQSILKFESTYSKFKTTPLPQRVLILGVTPELRDLVLSHDIECYSVDISESMEACFSAIMKHKNHPKDHVQIGDWREMDFPEGFFGAVFADASLSNLATQEDDEKVVSLVNKFLAKGGYFLSREFTYPSEFKPFTKQELTCQYRNNSITNADLFIEIRFWIYKDALWDKNKFTYDAKACFDMIDKDFKQGVYSKEEHDYMKKFRNNIINCIYPKEKFILMVCSKGFSFEKEFVDPSFRFTKFLSMYVFRKI